MEGYTDSPLGKIPTSWEVVKLENICIPKEGMRRGPFGGAIKKEYFVDEGYQVYEQRNAIYDDFESARYFINKEKYEELKAFKVQSNDFIISCSGTIGKIAKVPENIKEGVINQALLRLRLDRNVIVDDFFLQQFRFEPFQNKITDSTQGGAMKNLVGMADFRKTLLTLPPLPEQQKIAEILSTVDAKIEVIDQQISETKELKKGLMQRLLTKGIGHTEFKDSPLGKIPKSWEVVKLSEVTMKIGDGLHSTPKYVDNSKYYFVNGNNLVNGKLTVSEKTKCVSEDEFLKHNINIDSSSILMSINGTIGNLAFYSGERVVFGKSACFISPRGMKLDRNYLYYYLQLTEVKKYFLNELTGTTIQNLSLKTIRNTPTNLPPIQEQQKIAEILSSVDEKLEVLVEKKVNYQELKQGLMQQLLTGKIRVKV
jgi:type I restriction enzyme S subunit